MHGMVPGIQVLWTVSDVSKLVLDVAVSEHKRQVSSHICQFLLGLPIPPEQQHLFYALFLAMYLTTVLGNLIIIILIRLDSHLHTPMYLFLSNLSFSDLCFSSVTMPKLLQNMQSQDTSITYAGCLTQMYFFMVFANTENVLLVVMAYDRYVAICFPLHYMSIMSPSLCVSLVLLSWVLTTFHAMLHTLLMARLSFCEDNVIPHFFCDMSALLKLSCSDTSSSQIVVMTETLAVIVTPFLCILFSYMKIIVTVLRIPSAAGKWKAFSTCGSHLTVVALFYGSVIYVYFRPLSMYSVVKDRIATVMYTVVTPMMNPFIYSLRNRDMKRALNTLLCSVPSSS